MTSWIIKRKFFLIELCKLLFIWIISIAAFPFIKKSFREVYVFNIVPGTEVQGKVTKCIIEETDGGNVYYCTIKYNASGTTYILDEMLSQVEYGHLNVDSNVVVKYRNAVPSDATASPPVWRWVAFACAFGLVGAMIITLTGFVRALRQLKKINSLDTRTQTH